jgi:ferredoxin
MERRRSKPHRVTSRSEVDVALDIKIDREACMGSGNCSFWAPGVFDLDDDGIAVVLDPTAAPDDKIVLAAQGCPTQAIAVFDGDTKLV